MADYYRERDEGVPDGMRTWYQEVGHESHGVVVSTSDTARVREFWDTAANGDKTLIVPDDEEWKILWIQVVRANNATVGNRQQCVGVFDDTGLPLGILATAGAVQAASTTRYYTFGPGLADLTAFRDTNYLTTPIPTETILRQTWRLRIWDNKVIDLLDHMDIYVVVSVRKVSN